MAGSLNKDAVIACGKQTIVLESREGKELKGELVISAKASRDWYCSQGCEKRLKWI